MGRIAHALTSKHSYECEEEVDWGLVAKVAFSSLGFLALLTALCLITWGIVTASDASPEEKKAAAALQERKDKAMTDDKKRFTTHCEKMDMWADTGGTQDMWECRKKD